MYPITNLPIIRQGVQGNTCTIENTNCKILKVIYIFFGENAAHIEKVTVERQNPRKKKLMTIEI